MIQLPEGKAFPQTLDRESMFRNEHILFLGINAWDSLVQRPQHLAKGLAQKNRVLYVDPTAFSFLTKLATTVRRTKRVRGWKPALRRMSPSLLVFSPPPMLPLSLRSPAINRVNNRILERMLKRIFLEADFHPRVLWHSFPLSAPLTHRIPVDLICYDCMDNYPAFYEGQRGVLLEREETNLLRKADAVLVTDPALAEKCERHCEQTCLVPNAVPGDFLTRERPPCPPDLAPLPKPVIGYVGSLSSWIDFDLLVYLASERPKWTFLMVGPADRAKRPKTPPNLHYTGEIAYEDVLAYVDHMDVCLIPFVVNRLTHAVNPVKLYEYLARGKPVVATNTLAMKSFAEVCWVAKDREHFLAGVDAALQENTRGREGLSTQRIRLAEANTWDHRVHTVEEILGNLLQHRRKRGTG